jgi:hypothetical protein
MTSSSSSWIRNKHDTNHNDNNNKNSSEIGIVQYQFHEEGIIEHRGRKKSYRKYRAVINYIDGIQTISQPITVQEWIQYIQNDKNNNYNISFLLSHDEEKQKYPVTNDNHKNENDRMIQNGSTNGAISNLIAILEEDVTYEAYYFETPPVNSITYLTQSFEFVIVNAPELRLGPGHSSQYHVFQQECNQANEQNEYSCTFPNLSGDATLVVPKKNQNDGNDSDFPHLAQFIRTASMHQMNPVFRMIATTYSQQIIATNNRMVENDDDSNYIWLSTSGLGVAWLHFRLDTYPKYYSYSPYKITPFRTSIPTNTPITSSKNTRNDDNKNQI